MKQEKPVAFTIDPATTIGHLTLAVDLESLLKKADDRPFAGLPPGSSLGHIHLRLNDVKKAVEFYRDVLGFQVMALWPGTGFLNAGGYHHHIGVNM